MSVTANREDAVLFGPFRLLPAQRLLLQGDRPVRLGSRALDLLVALIRRAGETVTKPELAETVWPGVQVVGEGTIRVHVLELRKALGDGRDGRRYVSTVPGRGYCFVAPVTSTGDQTTSPRPPQALVPRHTGSLPTLPTRVIGRDDALATVASQFSLVRLVTIVGGGGIGKTTLALAVAEHMAESYADGVWFVDLAPVRESSFVASAVATALGVEVGSTDPTERLLAFARDRRILLVIDNCEHVIDAAASIISKLMHGTSATCVLATSRERLRVRGEHVYRLGGLECPPIGTGIVADEARHYPAVQLFVERAAACLVGFELCDASAPIVAEICSRLDGVALAIELAAARVEEFGVRGLAAGVNDRFRVLSVGSRTGTTRHRTLRAALDWSYQLLSQSEQAIFRGLAIFAGGFTLHAACTVVASAGDEWDDVAEIVADLVMKSLVATDLRGGDVRFRLLETTRAYALEKLAESGEAADIGRRHALYYRELLEAPGGMAAQPDPAGAYRPEVDNIRAALTWSFAPGGDRLIASALAAASARVWLDMSLLAECRSWSEKALDVVDAADQGTRQELVLQTALGITLMFTRGASDRARLALARAIELAERINDRDGQLRAFTALANFLIRVGDFRGAFALGRQAEAIATKSDDPFALSTADWILATSLFFLGDYDQALAHAHRRQRSAIPTSRREHFSRWEVDEPVTIGNVVAYVWWVRGQLDQAKRASRELVVEAQASAHPLSACLALLWCGCGMSFWLGDFETTERSVARLKDQAERHALNAFLAHSMGFEGLLSLKRGQTEAGIRLLQACLDGLGRMQIEVLSVIYLGRLAESLATVGDFSGSIAAIDEALKRVERHDELWLMPETLRITGEISLLSGSTNTDSTEGFLRRSLDLAQRQGALSWELRTAMSLGRLYRAQGRGQEARNVLNSVYARFTEGFATADLQAARRLLEEWGAGENSSRV